MNDTEFRIIEAYIINSWSQRRIQEEVLCIEAPTRGGGFEAMKILHLYGIGKRHKGILANQKLNRELFAKLGTIEEYLKK
jgi:hypothetical protein